MKPISPTIDKETIVQLPPVHFEGEIRVIDTPEAAAEACALLRRETLIGFDTETRPSFQKGVLHPVALMQLAMPNRCYLFRLNRLGIPTSLIDLLTNERVTKIGISVKDDFSCLRRRDKHFEPNGFIDIQDIIHQYGIEEKSLQKIFAILFGKRISKSQRLTNWETETLSESQQHYAALDAWACLKIYERLKELRIEN